MLDPMIQTLLIHNFLEPKEPISVICLPPRTRIHHLVPTQKPIPLKQHRHSNAVKAA